MPIAFRLAVLALSLAATLAAHADESWPNRPIKWIVPYQAGTSPDQTVRVIADAMSAQLKQPVVVDNRPGAAGNIGAQAAARSAPDGYTWVYSGSPMASSMRMYKKPGYDALKDFIHISRIGISELTVVTGPDSGFKSLRDLLEAARKQPGKLSFGSGGIGSPAHLGAELMLHRAGVQAVHVPYKGASESTNAVIGRHVDFTLAITSVALPHLQSGKLLGLAVTGPQRNVHLPAVPTLSEAGVPVTLVSVGGLSVPAGTPPAIVQRIGDLLHRVLAMPDVKSRLDAMGGTIGASSSAAYTEALRAEIGNAEQMMSAARIEAQ